MVARGHLIGVILLGERAGGEAYAPDEVHALEQFARGVGSALETLATTDRGSPPAFQQSMLEGIASLQHANRFNSRHNR